MNKEKIKYFKNKLLIERKKQVDLLNNREKNDNSNLDLFENQSSSYDNHPADMATEVYSMEQEKGFKEQAEKIIEEIDSSLEDIKNGVYGFCNNCNKYIDEERLELIPYAKTCIKCSDDEYDEYDERVNEEVRKNEKKYESVSNEAFNLEVKDNVGYDRADVFKDVVEDNIVPNDPSFSGGDNTGIISKDNSDLGIAEDGEKISEEE